MGQVMGSIPASGVQQAPADRLDQLMTGVPACGPSQDNYVIEPFV